MARPKKQSPPVKEIIKPIRFTEEQVEIIEKNARAAHMTFSEYIRSAALGKQIHAHYEVVYNSEELLQVFRNLGNISGNLNQIARYLNQGGRMTNEMWKTVSDCIAQILHMRDQVKEMAGEYRGDS